MQPWNDFSVAVFAGTFDTHIKTGEDYDTRTLADVFTMQPDNRPKGSGLAFIPSSYADFDARDHSAQRERGSFVALTGDIDCGNHKGIAVQRAVMEFAGDAAYLIYSSAHARPGDMRWRIVLPLSEPVPFDTWHDAQCAFFAFMGSRGIEMDHALARAAQPVYAPNVPTIHAKSGTALRDEDGKPLFYKSKATPISAPGLSLATGHVADGIAAIRAKRRDDEIERERIRREAEARRAAKPRGDGASVIDDFNAANSVATMLELCGYEQSPRHPEDWRSPHQQGETYATRVIGSKWVSLSASDVAARLGETCKSGCFGDAYDLYVHYKHGGDHKAAYRALRAEQVGANVVPFPTPEPPEWMAEVPSYDEPPEWVVADAEPVVDAPEVEAPAPEFRTVDAFDFDEANIPPRPWIIPGVMLSGYTHMLVAPGGSGKSLFTLQLAITLATGEAWGDMEPRKACRALVINVEDDMQEQRRRLAAARRVMNKEVSALRGMIDLAEDPESIIVARADPNRKTVVATPVVDALRRYIIDHNIGVLIVDPFAETFEGDENSNSEVKWAMRIWRDEIARPTGCAVYLVHHTTKGAENGAGNADIVRGAGSIVNSTRITATLMPMSTNDAETIGIDPAERYKFVRYDDAKANQSLKSGRARWFEKISVQLTNGTEDAPADEVGALRPWTPPSPFDGVTTSHLRRVQQAVGNGRWRENQQASEWVGRAVADVMMMDPDEPKDRKRILSLLKEWIRNDVLRVVEDEDETRRKRKFVVVGKWAGE